MLHPQFGAAAAFQDPTKRRRRGLLSASGMQPMQPLGLEAQAEPMKQMGLANPTGQTENLGLGTKIGLGVRGIGAEGLFRMAAGMAKGAMPGGNLGEGLQGMMQGYDDHKLSQREDQQFDFAKEQMQGWRYGQNRKQADDQRTDANRETILRTARSMNLTPAEMAAAEADPMGWATAMGMPISRPQQAELDARTGEFERTFNQRERFQKQDIETRIAGINADMTPKPARLTGGQILGAEDAFASADLLSQRLADFKKKVSMASDADLAGIGPGGANLASAQRMLAMEMKGPGALNLGALVGADFGILKDIIGEPGDLSQLVKQGGRKGALSRLDEVDGFINGNRAKLKTSYRQFQDQLPQVYAPQPDRSRWGAQPSRSDMFKLRQDSSAAARKEFDDVYGPGSAAKILAPGRH